MTITNSGRGPQGRAKGIKKGRAPFYTDTKDSYLEHFLSTSEPENLAPPRSPVRSSPPKRGRFSSPEVPDPTYQAHVGRALRGGRTPQTRRSGPRAAASQGPRTTRRAVDGAAYKGTQRHLGREASPHVD